MYGTVDVSPIIITVCAELVSMRCTEDIVPADIHVYPVQRLCVCGITYKLPAVTYRKEMNMKVYLVDFENVKSKGLTGIDSLTEYDRVIIFYSENADTINFEMHQKVLISKAEVEYFKVNVGGKNALDFQLSTLLGYLVSRNYYTHIFVISNDKSFDFLHDFWHGKYIAAPDCIVYRTRTIAQAINYAGGKKQIIEDDDMLENDTAVFGSSDDNDTTEAAGEPVQEEKPAEQTVTVQETAAPAEETAPAKETAQEKPEPAAEEKPAKDKAEKDNVKKPEKKADKLAAEEKQDDISSDDLAALEAAFKPYTIVQTAEKPDEKTDKDPEPKAEQKPAANKAPVQAQTKQEEKPAPKSEPKAEDKTKQKKTNAKQGKSFFATLRDVLKKSECSHEDINKISQLLINSETKEEFHNSLAKDYKQQATDFYKLLRPRYLRLKEMYAAEHPEYTDPNEVVVQSVPEQPEKPETNGKSSAKAEKPAPSKDDSRLTELLGNICSGEELTQIAALLTEAPTKQQFYIRMIKLFGKTKGCNFYNIIKGEYAALSEKK